ncbi:MAG: hypothetical protein DSY89_07505, partial [Deltaproteobacteria bacterium]
VVCNTALIFVIFERNVNGRSKNRLNNQGIILGNGDFFLKSRRTSPIFSLNSLNKARSLIDL